MRSDLVMRALRPAKLQQRVRSCSNLRAKLRRCHGRKPLFSSTTASFIAWLAVAAIVMSDEREVGDLFSEEVRQQFGKPPSSTSAPVHTDPAHSPLDDLFSEDVRKQFGKQPAPTFRPQPERPQYSWQDLLAQEATMSDCTAMVNETSSSYRSASGAGTPQQSSMTALPRSLSGIE